MTPAQFFAMFNGFNIYGQQKDPNIPSRPFSVEPRDWMDLQQRVGQIFEILGFQVEIEKTIPLGARGKVTIDVYCQRKRWDGVEKVIVECKNWKENIPQTVIHSVRSIAVDLGANSAFVVSKKGFQSGAIEGVTDTVVKLLTFDELIDSVKGKWFAAFTSEYYERAKPIKRFNSLLEKLNWQPGTPNGFVDQISYDAYKELANHYLFILQHIRYIEQMIRVNLEDIPDPFEAIATTSVDDFLNLMPLLVVDDNEVININDALDMSKIILKTSLIDDFIAHLTKFNDQYNECAKQ